MRDNHLLRWLCVFFIISFWFSTYIDGKGFGGGRGGGFKGGSRGGGIFGGSKSSGTFGGSNSYNRVNNYGSYNKPYSGSGFGKNAMSFGAGAMTGIAAYSLMSSMSRGYRPGYYGPGYGTGETCYNNEDFNGTKFGSFRCPLNGFSHEQKYCCGEYGKQYCCIRETRSSYNSHGGISFGWLFLIILALLLCVLIVVYQRRRQQKDIVMIPVEPPLDEQPGAQYYPSVPPTGYHPQSHPAGYHPPPPPMGYPPPPMGNPYAVPPQNYDGSYNPYTQPPQQQQQFHQMPYPPQQQAYNPYQVKEGGPPAYDDAMRNNQGVPVTKPN